MAPPPFLLLTSRSARILPPRPIIGSLPTRESPTSRVADELVLPFRFGRIVMSLQPRKSPNRRHHIARRLRRVIASAALAAPMLSASPGRADSTWAWFGQANLTTWSQSNNWFSHTAPVSSPLTHITFNGSWGAVSVQDRADPFQLNTLSFFDTAAKSYSIRGQALRFEAGSQVSGITQNSPNVQE